MSSIKFLFLFFSLLVFAQPRLDTQSSRPNCAGKDKRETICSMAGCNQLMIAAENGELIRVRAFLEEGVDVNARSKSGHTALSSHGGQPKIWAVTLKQKLTSIAQREPNRWPDRWSDDDKDPYPDRPVKPTKK